MAPKPTEPKQRHLCGATVIRCTACRKTVAKARVRKGLACPKHPDAATEPGTCENPVRIEGGRCRPHGAKAPQVVEAAKRRLLAAEATLQLTQMGVSIETTPVEALEAMLWEAAGNVAVLRSMVAELPLQEARWGNREEGIPPQPGIYGGTLHQSGIPTGEGKPHVLVVMYNEERDRLAKLAEACAKLGLDERKVRIAETEVGRLFDHVTGAIADIGLTAEQTAGFKKALAARIRGGS